MQKQIGAIFLIAGTCIGSGVIALPMVLAKLGIIPSLLIMIVTWSLAYYTSLFSVELNLHSEKGLPLGAMCKVFSGKYAEIVGNTSLKLLLYALLSVYIHGESSVIGKLLETHSIFCDPIVMSTILAVVIFLLLQLPFHIVDKINRISFLLLIGIFSIPLFALIVSIDWFQLPMVQDVSANSITSVISIVFTSFGFQVIFHTLRDYLGKDSKGLKRAFLFGSMIPAVVYILWTCGVLSAMYGSNMDFYHRMATDGVGVGEVINELSKIAGLPQLQMLVWWLSIFAIFTSILGVGVGLVGSFNTMFEKIVPVVWKRNITSTLIAILPSYLVAILVPNAFIRVFKFAGAILTLIAILLPMYLLWASKIKDLNYKELKNKLLILLSLLFAIGIIVIEICGVM
ncbi:MAG: hypothetical protein LBP31_02670 [Holosporales bacterium]|jgi:tyrosine-specific transport protein|nr:hypothetical protein [Holosporales bacterium]